MDLFIYLQLLIGRLVSCGIDSVEYVVMLSVYLLWDFWSACSVFVWISDLNHPLRSCKRPKRQIACAAIHLLTCRRYFSDRPQLANQHEPLFRPSFLFSRSESFAFCDLSLTEGVRLIVHERERERKTLQTCGRRHTFVGVSVSGQSVLCSVDTLIIYPPPPVTSAGMEKT